VGLAVGVVVAVVSASTGSLGRGLMLAGPLLALCVLLGVVIGELRVTAPPRASERQCWRGAGCATTCRFGWRAWC
jgi:hypothetical protein